MGPVEQMHQELQRWVPEGSEVYSAGYLPTDSREFIGWRVDFPDGVVARVSFRAEHVESALDALWDTIQSHSLLQGKSGNYRVEPGVVIPNPAEWSPWAR